MECESLRFIVEQDGGKKKSNYGPGDLQAATCNLTFSLKC